MSHANSVRHALLLFAVMGSAACTIHDLAEPDEKGAVKGNGGAGSTSGTGGSVSVKPVYLGELSPTSSDNGWGPYEIDSSNGEEESGDGKSLSVAGETFAKGLGTHSPSSLFYHLGGAYAHLTTLVGVDDEVKVNPNCGSSVGSVVFAVELDGERVFESELISTGDAATLADLDLGGAETLVLVVSDGGDGNLCDHADWLEARIFPGTLPDDTAPVISDIVAVASGGGATITWSTDDTSLGFVEVDGKRVDGSGFTRRHSVNLAGLEPGATVEFRVGATNRNDLLATSQEQQLALPKSGAPPIPTGAKLVSDFGAVPDDDGDDTAAILAAASAAGDGGAIGFEAGVYDVSGGPTLPAKRQYIGAGAKLRGKGANGEMLVFKGDDIVFAGFTLEGGGIFIDHPGGGFNTNIDFSWNRFYIDTTGMHRSGITATSGFKDSQITNNYFTGQNMSFGIYGYNYNGLTIANNEFVDVGAGMHIDAFGDSGNLLVEQNYIKGAKGMGMEFQSSATGLVFQDNWYEHPNLSSDPTKNGNSMAFSLILDKSKNIHIRRNTVLAPERPDGKGCRIGFEIGGDDSVVEDNYVNGVNHVAAMNDGVGTASVVFKNNKMQDYLEPPSCSFCNADRTFLMQNNGPDVTLSWDIGRGPPGIGKRY